MSCLPDQPFNDLPRLSPAMELESKQVLKACVKARTEVAELNQANDMLPNRTLLINVMPLLEAQASSEIENIVTTTDQLFRSSLLDTDSDAATKEALNYRRALREGFETLARINHKPSTATSVRRLFTALGLNFAIHSMYSYSSQRNPAPALYPSTSRCVSLRSL